MPTALMEDNYLANMPNNSIYTEYFTHTKQYVATYGSKTVVLMQVGAFFEVYGVKDAKTQDILYSDIVGFAEICQLNISEKTQQFASGQIVMAGFRDFTIEKYLTRLTDMGYTVPVFVQEKNGKEITRSLDKVYSPGTYINCDTDSSPKISNNILCVWIETFKPMRHMVSSGVKSRDTIVYGVSVVNIFTGESSIFQHETPYFLNVSTFDELERYISVFTPSEAIIITPFDKPEIQSILQFSGLQTQTIHFVDTRDKADKVVANCCSQKYIRELLSTFFGTESYDVCVEFGTNIVATQSLCYLLHFIQEHNSKLVQKIMVPTFNNTSSRMVLANHTLAQLNIIGDMNDAPSENKRLSSILAFLNRCCSPMGRRKFQNQLTNPTFDVEWLETEYAMIRTLLSGDYTVIGEVRKQLSHIRDIDKLCRQLVLRKIYPSSMYHLYISIKSVSQINEIFLDKADVSHYLCTGVVDGGYDYIKRMTTLLAEYLEKMFVMDVCKTTSSLTTFNENILHRGVSSDLDAAVDIYEESQRNFNLIHRFLNTIIQERDNTPDVEYVKVHETEKSGLSLQITVKRSQIIKSMAESPSTRKKAYEIIPGSFITLNEIRFVKSSANNYAIEFSLLADVCRTMLTSKQLVNQLIASTYLEVLSELETTQFGALETSSRYVANIDVLQSKVYTAREYNYCEPVIDKHAPKSYVAANGLRHCLIEHLQQNELYVVNDLSLGKEDDANGVLLYGTNAVGKTSLIRAIGVAVVMAQAGMFVPCTSFRYSPYTAIFSRILGNDNIFKGLSTFAVEMSELRVILKMADENSLILGDELCSGTETESALSIFVAGLIELHKKRSSFIFATHFHEIIQYDEVQHLRQLALKHMSVSYSRELDCLVYDRKLKDGSGPRIYGLEVCKSLYMEEAFLDLAYSIRNKYYPDTKGVLSHKPCVYNAKKLRGLCEMCGINISEETHHINEQHLADQNGFIGSFHKNHKANLLSVCEKCHTSIHTSSNTSPDAAPAKIVRKKTTKGYKLSPPP